MYTPIQLLILCDPQKVPSKKKFNYQLHLLPYPNGLKQYNQYTILPRKTTAFLLNINSSNVVIEQCVQELQTEFQISLDWREPFPSIESDTIGWLNTQQEEEGYRLQIRSEFILLHAATLHGLFNACQTLHQLIQSSLNIPVFEDPSSGFLFPWLEIEDWPCLKIRGVADDVSRGQIPSVESAKRFIHEMSHYKLNFYALYIEDVFKCSKHPKIGENRGAFTAQELLELDRYAKSRFITLIPILETLGHMDNILTFPEYQDLGEFPGAQCLSIANGNIYPFLRDFIEELSPCFSSKIFHIGSDESFDLGHGSSKNLIQAVGTGHALLDHFRKVIAIAKENGNQQIILYHDVIMKYPEVLAGLPKDTIMMYWDYNPAKKYPKIYKLLAAGFPVIVSPSMLCWTRPFPDFRNSAKNIINIIEVAKKAQEMDNQVENPNFGKILGQLTSTWGDFSNHNLRENNIYGAILSAAVSWTKTPTQIHQFLKDFGVLFFGFKNESASDFFATFFTEIADLNRFTMRKPVIIFQNFYDLLFRHPFRDLSFKPFLPTYQKLEKQTSYLQKKFHRLNSETSCNESYLPYLKYAIDISSLLAKKDVLRVSINQSLLQIEKTAIPIHEDQLHRMMHEIDVFLELTRGLRDQYSILWKTCAKEPNLERPLSRFNALLSFCEQKKSELQSNVLFVNPMLPSAYIWTHERFSSPKARYFREEFQILHSVSSAKMQVIAGNVAAIWINGRFVGQVLSRFSLSILSIKQIVRVFDITEYLYQGINIIGIEADHYLESQGSLNVFIEYSEENPDETQSKYQICSDGTWQMSFGPFDNNSWSTSEYHLDKSLWSPAKVLGYPPDLNSDLYRPQLLKDEQSINEDDFGLRNSIYFIMEFMFGKLIARIVRFFIRTK